MSVEVSGQWSVDINTDDTAIVLGFNHVSDDGVESFTTAMLPENAMEFAKAILIKANEMLDE